MNEVDVK